jgi:hypothetical protein
MHYPNQYLFEHVIYERYRIISEEFTSKIFTHLHFLFTEFNVNQTHVCCRIFPLVRCKTLGYQCFRSLSLVLQQFASFSTRFILDTLVRRHVSGPLAFWTSIPFPSAPLGSSLSIWKAYLALAAYNPHGKLIWRWRQ